MNLIEEFDRLGVAGTQESVDRYEQPGSPKMFDEFDSTTNGELPLISVDSTIRQASRGRGQLVSMCCCNETLVAATSRGYLLKYYWDEYETEKVIEVEVSKALDTRIKNIFMDPGGNHILINVKTGGQMETHYLHRKYQKTRVLTKMRGLVVTAVGWQKQPYDSPELQGAPEGSVFSVKTGKSGASDISDATGLESYTGDVIIGTDQGSLYELRVDERQRKEHYFQQLYDFKDRQAVVSGLEQELLPGGRRLVMVATHAHLFVFNGTGSLHSLFHTYQPPELSTALEDALDYYSTMQPTSQQQSTQNPVSPLIEAELPSFHNQLHLLRPPGCLDTPPTRFAWLVGCVIYTGTIALPTHPSDPQDSLVIGSDGRLQVVEGTPSVEDEPTGMVMTDYHFVVLYADKLQAVNRVSGQAVSEIAFLGPNARGPLAAANIVPLGITRDPQTGSINMFSSDAVQEVVMVNEDRDMWKVYLAHKDYDSALRLCSSPSQRDVVYLQQAEAAFAAKEFESAAVLFAKISGGKPPFEDVALRLVEVQSPVALQAFLSTKLEVVGSSDKAQSTMLAAWLTELHLDTINRALLEAGGSNSERYQHAQQSLRDFLKKYVGVLDLNTTTTLLASYGRLDDLRYFAEYRNDHEAVLECLMQKPNGAPEALKVLRKPSVSPELVYKFAPALVDAAPQDTVDFWIGYRPALDPRRLLPALLRFGEPGQRASGRVEAVRYLQFGIDHLGCKDCAVHNLAVALYSLDADEQRLLHFLRTSRDSALRPLFDTKYALRLVRERRRPRSSVQLMCELGMYDDAVELALQEGDVELAKVVAGLPEDDNNIRRRLWLAIARHVVMGGGGSDQAASIKQAVDFLGEAGGLLRIEDILPFFPDFVTIDNFKAAICESLERYNRQIQHLKAEMDDATEIADAVRKDLALLATRTAAMPSHQRCASCNRLIMDSPPQLSIPTGGAIQPFFLFPTGLAYHGACCAAEVLALVSEHHATKINALLSRLSKVQPGAITAPAYEHWPEEQLTTLQAQFEDEVASECPRNGEVLVRMVDQPFLTEQDLRQEMSSWAI